MASHVVVIDSSARRATVKTTPNKYLSDVLEEACTKLGLSASQYGLKNNNKQIDLSRTIRLSGLSSGAKLELIQLSKSVGVVSVALQLPESEAKGTPNGRLTDKFPSTTTLWLILRKFEAGVAGGGESTKRNLTARGVPSTSTSGSGRLYYESPVLQVVGRELSSFADLQKTLAQLGLNSGSALLRLNFRTTETPLEEAMADVQNHFNTIAGGQTMEPIPPAIASTREPETSTTEPGTAESEPSQSRPVPEWTAEEAAQRPSSPPSGAATMPPSSPTMSSSGRPISVYAAPTSSTPQAAQASAFNPTDYMPTVEHAHAHQRMLSQSSRNIRLPTEAEMASKAAEDKEKLATIREVEIKVRFPDESAVSVKFGQQDSVRQLYTFVRECLWEGWRDEKFILREPGFKGGRPILESDTKLLIQHLGLRGRVLLVFQWDDGDGGASPEAKATKQVLREDLRAQARKVDLTEFAARVDAAATAADDADTGTRVDLGTGLKGEEVGQDRERKRGGMPKWLKGLSKK